MSDLRSRWMNPDFTLSSHGEVLTLCARTDRGLTRLMRLPEAKVTARPVDRILLNREKAREMVSLLKFEGYRIKGDELI
jgi:hypothetical protein